MIIAISFILGLGLWLYWLKTAFVTGIMMPTKSAIMTNSRNL